jgi:hypothetical protein
VDQFHKPRGSRSHHFPGRPRTESRGGPAEERISAPRRLAFKGKVLEFTYRFKSVIKPISTTFWYSLNRGNATGIWSFCTMLGAGMSAPNPIARYVRNGAPKFLNSDDGHRTNWVGAPNNANFKKAVVGLYRGPDQTGHHGEVQNRAQDRLQFKSGVI